MSTPDWILTKLRADHVSFCKLFLGMWGLACTFFCGAPMSVWSPAKADQPTVRIIEEPVVSQPSPFSSGGKTVVVPRTRIIIDQGARRDRKADARQVRLEGKPQVIDGDTIRISGRVINLYGIDAVEGAQSCRFEGVSYPCGVMATAHLVELTLGRIIICRGEDKDRDNTLLAICQIGTDDLNDLMVKHGWALAYTKQSDLYVSAQEHAKRKQSGLWRGEFVRPWVWRIKN